MSGKLAEKRKCLRLFLAVAYKQYRIDMCISYDRYTFGRTTAGYFFWEIGS